MQSEHFPHSTFQRQLVLHSQNVPFACGLRELPVRTFSEKQKRAVFTNRSQVLNNSTTKMTNTIDCASSIDNYELLSVCKPKGKKVKTLKEVHV
ncbi:hypothetical protein QQF64_024262 [Cirrhinus molitorella]|uniref:Uncharacterized protein n=1 Tax=Cirrhinus molitorella TaxID=172907 RepID=A0ABR3NKR3_9TELE